MKFIDLSAQQKHIRNKIDRNILKVLDHGQYVMGPEIEELEETLRKYVGVKYAIACSSGTDALLLALLAHNIGPGDAVFTTPFTFIASAEVVSLLGATPVFVDIDPRTFNMDPEKLDQAVAAFKTKDNRGHSLPISCRQSDITPKVVMAVDLFGLPADFDRINAIAAKYGLLVVEDAAQSFGAEYKGKKACGLADIGCTSFFPAKPLGCYGDGGMCFTDDEGSAEIMRSLRNHGQGFHKYDNVRIGINGRLDTLQAAILLAKFEVFQQEVELRQQVARRYNDLLSAPGSTGNIRIPLVPDKMRSVWAQYSILAQNNDHRQSLQTILNNADIPTAIHYPNPLHLQTAFACLGYKQGDFPVSEDSSNRIFSLPMYPYLQAEDQERIAQLINGN